MSEDWQTEAEEFQAGWEAIQTQLSEDEDWARHLFEAFHGAEY